MAKKPTETRRAPAAEPKPDPAPPAPPAGRGASDAGILPRLSIPIGADGRPAFDRMRDSTRAQFADILKDPATARALGIGDTPSTEKIPPQLIPPLVRAVSMIETILLARITKAPPDIIMAIAPFTDEEMNAIAPLAENVLNKYSGGWMTQYGDEIALAFVLVSLTAQKLNAITQAMNAARPSATVHPFRPASPEPAPAAEPATGEPSATVES